MTMTADNKEIGAGRMANSVIFSRIGRTMFVSNRTREKAGTIAKQKEEYRKDDIQVAATDSPCISSTTDGSIDSTATNYFAPERENMPPDLEIPEPSKLRLH